MSSDDPILNSQSAAQDTPAVHQNPERSHVLDTAETPGSAAPAAPFIGREVGGYRIEELVGAGGFSMVFRATRLASGETVALKLPRVAGFVGHLKREALMSARFQDPQVIGILEVQIECDPPFLVMPFVAGRNLELPPTAPAPARIAAALKRFRKIVEVVARLHAAEVVHGDLKPGNIRFDGEDRCLLLDLGLARQQLAARQLSTLRASVVSVTGEKIGGTLDFMSPEVMSGHAPGKPADVYALGVILHHMLCGMPPAFGISPEVLNPYLPPGAVLFLREMLEQDPAGRFPDARPLLPEIDGFIAAEERCLRRRNGHERRLVFAERVRTLLRGLKVFILADILLGALIFLPIRFAQSPSVRLPDDGELSRPDAWLVLLTPFAVLFAVLCLLLAMTTINAWALGVPERLYKNRRGHPLWNFLMQ